MDRYAGGARPQQCVARWRTRLLVCPLVSESELIDLAAAEDRANALRTIYGDKVGLVHGQMKAADKDG